MAKYFIGLIVPLVRKRPGVKLDTTGIRPKSYRSLSLPTMRQDSKPLRHGQLCRALKKSVNKGASQMSLRIEDDLIHHSIDEGHCLPCGATLGQSFPLSTFLLEHHCRRQKFILAYTLASSVWQFYDSRWTKVPWTLENLHLVDNAGNALNGSSSNLYLFSDFKDIESCPEMPEHCDEDHVVHRYPRILALSRLLIDILQGQSFSFEKHSSYYSPDTINQRYSALLTHFNEILRSKYKRYATYLDAIEVCLKFATYLDSVPGTPAHKSVLMERRKVLYMKVVCPLRIWLQKVECLPNIQDIKQPAAESFLDHSERLATVSSAPEALQADVTVNVPKGTSDPSVPPAALMLGHAPGLPSRSNPKTWLNDLASFSQEKLVDIPVRIAVLDTGCSLDAPIFQQPGEDDRVKKGWIDWVGHSDQPKDDDGHGTRITSLLLRIAPQAEIYVARVATNVEDLQHHTATQVIAEVRPPLSLCLRDY